MVHKKTIRILALVLILCMMIPVMAVSAYDDDRSAVERQIYTFLREKLRLNNAAACGILANIEAESGFTLNIMGDSGTSFGLCQWHSGRYAALVSFCNAFGMEHTSLRGQMEYLSYELHSNYSSLYSQLKSLQNTPQSAYTAAYLWCTSFERPANVEENASRRGQAAQFKYWNRYSNFVLPDREAEPVGMALNPKPEVTSSVREALEEIQLPAQPIYVSEENTVRHPMPDRKTAHRIMIKAYTPHHLPAESSDNAWTVGIGIAAGVFLMSGGAAAYWKFVFPRRKPETA